MQYAVHDVPEAAASRKTEHGAYDDVMATITIRTDQAVDEALDALTANGASKSTVIREAIVAAYREQRRARLRAEAEELRDDESDVTAARRLAAEMDAISAW